MDIRPLIPDDAKALRILRLMALRESPHAFGADYREDERLSIDDFRDRIHNSNQLIVGAFDHDHLVAMGGFFQQARLKLRHKGMIWGMYVSPPYRGRGLGRQLLQDIVSRASTTPGIEQIQLSVVSDNEAAKHLYRSAGFTVFGREHQALNVDGVYYDEDHMVLFVKASPG